VKLDGMKGTRQRADWFKILSLVLPTYPPLTYSTLRQLLKVSGFTSFYHHKENFSLIILNLEHLFFSEVFDVQSIF
jgi:hypothetical protein